MAGIPNEKKERALRILHEASFHEPPGKSTPLREVFYQAPPNLLPSNWLILVFAALVPFLCSAWIRIFGSLNPEVVTVKDLMPLLIICVVTIVLWYLTYWSIERRKLAKFGRSLREPFDELLRTSDHIRGYLSDLDSRTRRYFHCVTNTKVMSYLLLTHINHALTERTHLIESLMSKRSAENYLAAFEELRADLSVKDSVLEFGGEVHAVPLRKTKQAIDLLIEDLERGLGVLEAEISKAKMEEPSYE